MMRELISEIVRDQKIRERDISNDIKEYLEYKYRYINDHINNKWEYRKQDNKSAENQKQEESNLEENNEREQEESDKKKRLANIAKRHITDFTKNCDQDFTDVLRLPEITTDD